MYIVNKMEETEHNVFVDGILNNAQIHSEVVVENCEITLNCIEVQEKSYSNESLEKNSAVWTTESILRLLKLYEMKLGMLETPKRKTKIWIAIADSLKVYDVEVSPDQVRWKINALTKKYKQCMDNGQHDKFKYFSQLNNIYNKYNMYCDTYLTIPETVSRKSRVLGCQNSTAAHKKQAESKAVIELRKKRLAEKIESDRCQSKIKLEKQWLEYLKRQEEQILLKDAILARKVKLREEELELRKSELEMCESLELRRLQLKEKEHEQMLKFERQKCDLLERIYFY